MADYPDFTYRGDVDIIAQTIERVSVDIAAQTLATLGINITAQTLAELIIKIHAQDVGVYIERDWASTQDNDKTLTGGVVNAWDTGREDVISYAVDTGKVLYIDDIDICCHSIGTDKMAVWLVKNSTDIWRIYFQNDQPPYQRVFTTPKKIIAGETVKVQCDFVATTGSGGVVASLGGREYNV